MLTTAMRRGWVAALTALLVLVGAEAGVRTIADELPRSLPWGNLEAELKADRMTMLRRMDVRASVAFVGSSMMDVGVDPSKMGLDSTDELAFNGALFGTDARTMAFYTEKVVVPRLRPRVVVIGVSSFDLNDGGDTQRVAYENIIRSPEAQRLLGNQSFVERLEQLTSERSAILHHRQTLRSPTELTKDHFYRRDVSANAHGVLNAFPAHHPKYAVTGFFKRLAREESYKAFSVGGSQIRALDHIVGFLRSEGIGVVIVKMPLTRDAVVLHPNGGEDYERFKAAVRGVVQRHGVQYVDVPTAEDGSAGFYDPVHLNSAGKRYFTDALSRIVKGVLAGTMPTGERRVVPDVDRRDVNTGAVSAPHVDAPGAPDADARQADVPDAPPPPAPPAIVIPAPEPGTLNEPAV